MSDPVRSSESSAIDASRTTAELTPSSEPVAPSPEVDAATASSPPRCPVCGATGAEGDVFCEIDGTRLVATSKAAPAPSRAGRCSCGAAADDGDGYCLRCGHRIRPARPERTAADRRELAPFADLGAVTDRGLRHPRNEDAVELARETIDADSVTVLAVCDGVSSSSHGDQAATLAARAAVAGLLAGLRESDRSDAEGVTALVSRSILDAHAALCAQPPAAEDGRDPAGTTIVVAAVMRGQVHVGWVGDSRAYWATADGAGLLTHDDSWVSAVVDAGQMSEEDALRAPNAHALTRCLGPLEVQDGGSAPVPSTTAFQPPPGCTLILCSDGLWNYAPAAEALAGLTRGVPRETSAAALARQLVDFALDKGGQDNVTAAVLFLPEELPQE